MERREEKNRKQKGKTEKPPERRGGSRIIILLGKLLVSSPTRPCWKPFVVDKLDRLQLRRRIAYLLFNVVLTSKALAFLRAWWNRIGRALLKGKRGRKGRKQEWIVEQSKGTILWLDKERERRREMSPAWCAAMWFIVSLLLDLL